MKPTSKYGRAHFYAPYKQMGNIKIDTFWFNLMVLWIVTLVLYFALYYNLLQKLIGVFENTEISEFREVILFQPFLNGLGTQSW